MTIGNIESDDVYQAVAICFCVAALIAWMWVARHSSSPLYFLPPIIASGLTLVFYVAVSSVKMSTEIATTLSAATRLADMIMWTLSGVAMALIIRRNGRRV